MAHWSPLTAKLNRKYPSQPKKAASSRYSTMERNPVVRMGHAPFLEWRPTGWRTREPPRGAPWALPREGAGAGALAGIWDGLLRLLGAGGGVFSRKLRRLARRAA